MEFDKVKDSGVREDMSTGSRRDTQKGKSRPDLINPLVSRRLGMHMANGCDKYGEHNYELGQKTSRYLASLERHLLDFKEGLEDEDHAAAIMWNIHGIIMNGEFVERGIYPPEMDDRTDYRNKEGFDKTVRKRAEEFNDSLRKAEDTISDVTYEGCEECHHTHGTLMPEPCKKTDPDHDCFNCVYEQTDSLSLPCLDCDPDLSGGNRFEPHPDPAAGCDPLDLEPCMGVGIKTEVRSLEDGWDAPTPVHHSCADCEYKNNEVEHWPCHACDCDRCETPSAWEPVVFKNCEGCKHEPVEVSDEPCCSCADESDQPGNWEKKEPELEPYRLVARLEPVNDRGYAKLRDSVDEAEAHVVDPLVQALKNVPKQSKLICSIPDSTPGIPCRGRYVDDDHEGCDVQYLCSAGNDTCSFAERKFE